MRRVVTVGTTGLERALRDEGGVELVRARGALDAVGEVAMPLDAAQDGAGGGAETTVLVAGRADPGAEERSAFLEALRLAEPGVRVLYVGDGAAPAGYDGEVQPGDADAVGVALGRAEAVTGRDHLRDGLSARSVPRDLDAADDLASDEVALVQSLRSGGCDVAKVEPTAGEALEAAAAAPERPAADPAGSSPGWPAVAEAILNRRDATLPLLDVIRGMPGLGGAKLVAAGDAADSPGGVEIACGGRALVRLVCGGATGAQLEAGARAAVVWVALAERQRELEHLAFTDELTGAKNRRYFRRYMGQTLVEAGRQRRPVSVLAFDVDNFKEYNDAYGHEAGDEILVEMVRLLRSVIRPSDRVCRVGGDEFAVVFYDPAGPRDPGAAPQGPESILDLTKRFQRQICEHRFPKLGEQARGTLTISGGLASFPWDGRTAEELLCAADRLALESKRQGKNAITIGPGAEQVCRRG